MFDSLFRIGLLQDSLINGSPTSADTYAIAMSSALRSAFGDAGAGPVVWADGTMNGLSHSSGFISCDTLNAGSSSVPWTDPIKTLTPAGRGFYRSGGIGASDAEWLAYTPSLLDSFGRAKLGVLREAEVQFILGAGSSFDLMDYDVVANAPITTLNVSTSSQPVGLPGTVSLKLRASASPTILITHVLGSVTACLAETYEQTCGITITNLSNGGVSMFQLASLDAAAQQAWYGELDLDLISIILDMNSRTFLSADAFGNALEKKVRQIRAGSPRTKILLSRCNDSSDWSTTNLIDYTDVIRTICERHSCTFGDNRLVLGDFTEALRDGYMISSSNVHPSAAGNARIAEYQLELVKKMLGM